MQLSHYKLKRRLKGESGAIEVLAAVVVAVVTAVALTWAFTATRQLRRVASNNSQESTDLMLAHSVASLVKQEVADNYQAFVADSQWSACRNGVSNPTPTDFIKVLDVPTSVSDGSTCKVTPFQFTYFTTGSVGSNGKHFAYLKYLKTTDLKLKLNQYAVDTKVKIIQFNTAPDRMQLVGEITFTNRHSNKLMHARTLPLLIDIDRTINKPIQTDCRMCRTVPGEVCCPSGSSGSSGPGWKLVGGGGGGNVPGIYGPPGIPGPGYWPGGRHSPCSWLEADGSFYIFGGYGYGESGPVGHLSDMWKWNGTEWTFIGGSKTVNHPGNWGVMGVAAPGNWPGGVGWVQCAKDSGGNLWYYGGNGKDSTGATGNLSAIWKWDGTNWTWVAGSNLANQTPSHGALGVANASNSPGSRNGNMVWVDFTTNHLRTSGGYRGSKQNFADIWDWDGTYWTWVGGNISGWNSGYTSSGTIYSTAGMYGTIQEGSTGNWMGSRFSAGHWKDKIGNNYFFGGWGCDSNYCNNVVGSSAPGIQPLGLQDLWKWDPLSNRFTWMMGSDQIGALPTYGSKNVSNFTNVPGARYKTSYAVDPFARFVTFGGVAWDATGTQGLMNDLWVWDGNRWTWLSGVNTAFSLGNYGTVGVSSEVYMPSARQLSTMQIKPSGTVMVFAGNGCTSTDCNSATFNDTNNYYLNDLWEFTPPTMTTPPWILDGPDYDYGNVAVGTPTDKVFTIHNPGSTPIECLTVGAMANGFSLKTNACGATLAANTSCTMTVTFNPASAGPKVSQLTLLYTQAGVNGSESARLLGNGTSFTAGNTEPGWYPQLTVFNGKLYRVWSDTFKLRISVYNNNDVSPGWASVDAGGLEKETSRIPWFGQLTVHNSKLYATWIEAGFIGVFPQVRVAVYNADDSAPIWTFVDGDALNGLNINPLEGASYPQLTEFNSKLYLTWHEGDGGSPNKIFVKVYNGNDAAPVWTNVSATGLNYSLTMQANMPQLTAFNSKLYATWYESTAGSIFRIRVKVYNGNDAAPAWSWVDGGTVAGINRLAASTAIQPQLTVFNSKLYATWAEDPGCGTFNKIRVAVYNGNDAAPVWTMVDGNTVYGLNKEWTKNALYPQLTEFASELYLTWAEEAGVGNVFQIRLAKYNGNDATPVWTFVDGNLATGLNFDTANPAIYPQITTFSAKLYGIWQETIGGVVSIYSKRVQ